jgi:hypothetical protein
MSHAVKKASLYSLLDEFQADLHRMRIAIVVAEFMINAVDMLLDIMRIIGVIFAAAQG